jgi:hypothetical protein
MDDELVWPSLTVYNFSDIMKLEALSECVGLAPPSKLA